MEKWHVEFDVEVRKFIPGPDRDVEVTMSRDDMNEVQIALDDIPKELTLEELGLYATVTNIDIDQVNRR